jgi:hypothetical protein
MGVIDALISIALIETVSGDFRSRVRSFPPILLPPDQGQHEVAPIRSSMVHICVCGPIYLIWAPTVSSDKIPLVESDDFCFPVYFRSLRRYGSDDPESWNSAIIVLLSLQSASYHITRYILPRLVEENPINCRASATIVDATTL